MPSSHDIPADLHREPEAQAAFEGQSLPEYALDELGKAKQRPTRRELVEQIAAFERITTSESAVEAVRAERDAR